MRLIDADALMDCGALRGDRYDNVMIFEIADAIDAAPTISPADNWIPCAERLPEEDGVYDITFVSWSGKRHVRDEGFDAETKKWESDFLDIIAWKERSAPWTGEKKGEADGFKADA